MNFLITIVGPTAIGKTALSIKLAQHFNCSIFSADSRQFFKEMEIGTAVPSKEELNQAKHYFIQNKSIFETYSVGNYEKEIIPFLETEFKKNNIQILVGGSGLYVNAVLKGIDTFPEVSINIRKDLNSKYEKFGLPFLLEEFKRVDCSYFHKLEIENPQTLHNPQRLKRFIEVSYAANKPYSSFLAQNKVLRNFKPIVIGLNAKRDVLYSRINKRVDIMLENGLLQEVEQLIQYQHLNALQTVGYKELFDFFCGKLSLDEALDQMKTNTRRFAKRQITWFSKIDKVSWFDYYTPVDEIVKEIENIISINSK